MNKKTLFTTIFVVLLFLVLVILGALISKREKGNLATQNEGGPVSTSLIEVDDQPIIGPVTIQEITLPRDGYAAVMRIGDAPDAGRVIGSSTFLPAGTYTNITIPLFDAQGNPYTGLKNNDELLVKMFEDNGDGVFSEADLGSPFKESSGSDTFAIFTVIPPTPNPILLVVEDQVVRDSVTVKEATLPQDGYIAIMRIGDAPDAGRVIGNSAFLEEGTYPNVVIPLFDAEGNPYQGLKPGDELLAKFLGDNGDKTLGETDLNIPLKDTAGADIFNTFEVK